MGLFMNVGSRVSVSGRRLRRKEYAQTKRIAQANIDSVKEAIAFREQEDPREQAALNQGMFARGLGKSSIADQDKGRLDMIQRHRRDSLNRGLQIAEKGLSLIKKRWTYSKRMQWAQSVDDLLSLVGGVATVYGAATGNAGMQAAGGAMQGAGQMAPNP
jgi:hypothetical protein